MDSLPRTPRLVAGRVGLHRDDQLGAVRQEQRLHPGAPPDHSWGVCSLIELAASSIRVDLVELTAVAYLLSCFHQQVAKHVCSAAQVWCSPKGGGLLAGWLAFMCLPPGTEVPGPATSS